MPIKIAINGFGRVGRAAYKIMQDRSAFEVVAINDLTDPQTLLHLLKYDTAYGKYERGCSIEEGYLVTDSKKSKLLSQKVPSELPWTELGIDVVLECTGFFIKDGASKAHLEAGAKGVVVSAPTKGGGDIKTYLKGVNESAYQGESVISNASCTTNCIAPAISVIHSALGVKKAGLTTIHAVTSDQNLVDGPHKDLRRARAAGYNIIPTTTGAAIATTKAIPDLEGKFDGLAVRVPILVGSLSDITMLVEKRTTVEEVNQLYIKAKESPLYKGILETTTDPIVSSDIVKTPYSSIIDLEMTKVIDGDLIKVLAWYDNEWGYSRSLVDMAAVLASQLS
jgi:glyceraldehyde 3-phosphate dehydrogenase